jgi:hypothetical protein
VIQHGQVFKLRTKGADGQPLWAYRYRFEGRGSARPQVGGFASRAEADAALRKALDRIGSGGGRATTTLCRPASRRRVRQAPTPTGGSSTPRHDGGTRPSAAFRERDLVPERTRWSDRLSELRSPPLETRATSRRNPAATRPLRPAPHLRHLRTACRHSSLRRLALHGLEHRDDRPLLRPPCARQPPARCLSSRRTRIRTRRGRWVDVAPAVTDPAQ